ncbi:MFS transporter [Acidocella sp.]|jgi:sugar phosphate permease|uniref:MFS transporter n=1 Tax=Acidocella sp. TaxID=50710 RepID=UPI002F3E3024
MSEKLSALDSRVRWVRLIPVVFLVYTIAFFDRINIGLALPSISRDLHLSPTQAGLAGGIFFWGYLITFLAAGWLAPRFGGRQVILGALIAWGAFAMGTGLVQNYHELLVMRFLLGAAEGPVWTSVSMLLAQWFIAPERARAFGLWNLCIPVGALIAGPVSGLILSYASWHLMFVLEGLPAWIWAFVWARTVPRRLQDAPWLDAAERTALSRALEAEQAELRSHHRGTWRDMLREPSVWLLLGAFSFVNMVSYGFGLWFPSAIKAASKLDIGSIGLLSALPYIASTIGVIAITQSSDRNRERRYHAGLPMIAIGTLLWVGAYFGSASIALEIGVFTFMGLFLYMYLPLIFTFLTEILPRDMAIPAIAFVGGVGNLFGGFIGPTLVGWVREETGSFTTAFTMLAVFGVVGGLLTLLVRPRSHSLEEMPRVYAEARVDKSR